MWEYKRMVIEFNNCVELNDKLKIEGENNWEIVHYVENEPDKYNKCFVAKILLKRQKESHII